MTICLSAFQSCSCSPFSYNLCGPVSPPHLLFIIPLPCPPLAPLFLTSLELSSLLLLLLPFCFPSHPSISCLLFSSLFFHTPHHPSLPPPCSVREKFVEVDLKPVCKHCYERLPDDMKRRLAKRERDSKEKKKKLIPMCL